MPRMGKSYVVIEGRGENGAVENLLCRLSVDLGHPEVFWKVGGAGSFAIASTSRFCCVIPARSAGR